MSYRRTLIRVVTFLGGIYFFLLYVLPSTVFGVRLDTYDAQITAGFSAIGAMAVGLGLINLLQVHGGKIVFRRSGWFFSLGLILGLATMIIVAIADWRASSLITEDTASIARLRDFAMRISDDAAGNVLGVLPLEERSQILARSFQELRSTLEPSDVAPSERERAAAPAEAAVVRERTLVDYSTALASADATVAQLSLDPSVDGLGATAQALGTLAALRREVLSQRYGLSSVRTMYTVFYDGLFVALGSAMFSLLGFYIAAAAYRAFRVRSAESGLMMGAAILVMLGQIPFGVWLWEGFPEVRLWLLSVPSTAAFRAIKIGAAVAGLILAFRMWFSIESENFSREKR